MPMLLKDEAVFLDEIWSNRHGVDKTILDIERFEEFVELLLGFIFSPIHMVEQNLIIPNKMGGSDGVEALRCRQQRVQQGCPGSMIT
jgi:hypothetical protein